MEAVLDPFTQRADSGPFARIGSMVELVGGHRLAERQRAAVALQAAQLAATGEWSLDGYRSAVMWLANGLDVPRHEARRLLREGEFLLRFDAVTAEVVERALHIARASDGPIDTRSRHERQADAVAAVFDFFVANCDSNGTPRHRPHVDLHIEVPADAAAQGRLVGPTVTEGGRRLPEWAAEKFACDCNLHRVLRADSVVLDYGRSTRTVLEPLRRAVSARDGGCRFPGCDRKRAWCDAHHVQWWRRHGDTKLDNLLLLCSHHHRVVHRDGWQVELQADGTAVFLSPQGGRLTTRPRGQPRQRAA